MSADTSTVVVADEPSTRAPRHRMRRRSTFVGGAAVVVLTGAAVASALVNSSGSSASSSKGQQGVTTTATMTRETLTSQTQVDATLGYAGSYSVVLPSSSSSAAAATGTFTRLPAVGQVVTRGHALYDVDGTPAVLLYGATPAYRTISAGMSGADVHELNANLVALGEATADQVDPRSDDFSSATAAALVKLQKRLGLPETGTLTVGQAVFLPSAARVTSVNVVVGGPAQPGSPVLQATSTIRDVVAQLDPAEQTEVTVGDRVNITLPDNRVIPGVVTSIGTVATTGTAGSSGSGSGSGSNGSQTSTIDVHIRPLHPAATGTLDQAPVNVTITTGSVRDALTVPVTALLAQAGGGYAVEVVDPDHTHRLMPVRLGLFDDADGLVQVSGSGLSAGQHVVVPKI